ncbi:hypothetical protein NFJ02_34g86560 [Pycnococcus provasolii]
MLRVSRLRATLYAAAFQRLLVTFAVDAWMPRRTAERMVGRLNSVADASRWLSIYLPEFYRLLHPAAGGAPDPVQWTSACDEALRHIFIPKLEAYDVAWLSKSRWCCLPIREALTWPHGVVYSDASTSYGVGASVRGRHLQRETSAGREGVGGINGLEVAGMGGAFAAAIAGDPAQRRWLGYMDNRAYHLLSGGVLKKVLQMLRRTGLKAHPTKCKVGGPTMQFLGHEVGGDGITPEAAMVASGVLATW